MNTRDYLAAVKSALCIESDYALAKALGVSKQRISSYQTGASTFDVLMCAKVAEVLQVPELRVIADVEIERAKAGPVRNVWERIARSAAAACLVSLGAGIVSPPQANAIQSADSSGRVCITLNPLRRRKGAAAAVGRAAESVAAIACAITGIRTHRLI